MGARPCWTGYVAVDDVDGAADKVRLQHALGLAYHDGQLYVADTYNSKIKRLDPVKRTCTTFLGGEPEGWLAGPVFSEPGGLSYADGKIYVGEVQARFHILKPGPDKCERLHFQFFRGPAGDEAVIEINGSPAVANGRIYFSTSRDTYCIGKKEQTHAAATSPRPATDEPANPSTKVAHLQVVPAATGRRATTGPALRGGTAPESFAWKAAGAG